MSISGKISYLKYSVASASGPLKNISFYSTFTYLCLIKNYLNENFRNYLGLQFYNNSYTVDNAQ